MRRCPRSVRVVMVFRVRRRADCGRHVIAPPVAARHDVCPVLRHCVCHPVARPAPAVDSNGPSSLPVALFTGLAGRGMRKAGA